MRAEQGEPMHVRIARELRGRIISGELDIGARLPSGRELWKSGAVGRNTYSQAVGLLKSEGLVVTRAGQGNFVAARPRLHVVTLHQHDRVAARQATEEEREAHAGLLTTVLVVTRADGAEEVHPAPTTICRVHITAPLCPSLG